MNKQEWENTYFPSLNENLEAADEISDVTLDSLDEVLLAKKRFAKKAYLNARNCKIILCLIQHEANQRKLYSEETAGKISGLLAENEAQSVPDFQPNIEIRNFYDQTKNKVKEIIKIVASVELGKLRLINSVKLIKDNKKIIKNNYKEWEKEKKQQDFERFDKVISKSFNNILNETRTIMRDMRNFKNEQLTCRENEKKIAQMHERIVELLRAETV